jgi:hypothetical protein
MRRRPDARLKAAAALAAAAIVYTMAAWTVAPGFYDCCQPPQPYNFVCPPAQAGASLPPKSGRDVINVIDGISEPSSAFTDDGQAVIGFLSGAFAVTGNSTVTVDITPVVPCPQPASLHFVTNTYEIRADAALRTSSNLKLTYSGLVPDPSYVYRAETLTGPWTSLAPAAQAQIWTIDTKTDNLGYFAAGYPSNAVSKPGGSGQLLPITVAVLIIAVLLAGIPLSIVRRRSAARRPADDEDDS